MGRVIVVACDSFKGSLSSVGVGEALAAGRAASAPEDRLDILPIADVLGLRTAIESAGLVVMGEGRFDAQSTRGKVVGRLQQLAPC